MPDTAPKLDLNRAPKADTQPVTLPLPVEALRRISDVKASLAQTPDNQALLQRWKWDDARLQPDGSISIPAAEGRDLKIVSAEQGRKAGSPLGLAAADIEVRPPAEYGAQLNQMLANFKECGAVLQEPAPENLTALLYRSIFEHEVTHTKERAGWGGRSEFEAYAAQMTYLQHMGVLKSFPPEAALGIAARSYPAESYAESWLSYSKGEINDRTRAYLPGGEAFKRLVTLDHEDPLKSAYCKKFLGAAEFFQTSQRFAELRQQGSAEEPAWAQAEADAAALKAKIAQALKRTPR